MNWFKIKNHLKKLGGLTDEPAEGLEPTTC
jgi:hypothetical protein